MGGGGEEGKREYANGGGVVSRGLVGRLQPRFPGATLCTLLPPASSLHPDPTSTLPPLSLSLSLFPLRRSFALFRCVSLFLLRSEGRGAYTLPENYYTGKALRTRVRQTAGLTNGITLILVSFGPTD